MRTSPFLASLLATAVTASALAVPSSAFAQNGPDRADSPGPPGLPPPPPPVQPVPYAPTQPVPYVVAPAPAGAAGAVAPSAGQPTDPTVVVNVAPAAPLPVGNDVVYLKGAAMLRGTLIESIPNDHVTLQMATGQTAVIPWDRIERIERTSNHATFPQAPRPPAPPPPPPPASTSPGEGTAVVHIEADSPVTLERRAPGTRSWVPQCTSPCDVAVPRWGAYRITGQGVRTSNDFSLKAQPDEHVMLEVSTASKGGFAGGIVLTSVGGFAMLLGATVLVSVAAAEADPAGATNSNADGSANSVGAVLLAGGAAAAIVGVIVLVRNRHSDVDQSTAHPSAASAARPRSDAWLRQPQWHDDKSAQGLPKPLGAPLFEMKF